MNNEPESTPAIEPEPIAYEVPSVDPWGSKTIGDIAKRLAHAMTLVAGMTPDGFNDFHSYKYFSITQMQAEARKVCGLAGVCFFPTVTRAVDETFDAGGKTQVRVVCQLTVRWIAADSGEWLESRWIAEALDNGDKAFNKAYTAAIKQCLQKTLLLGGDADADAESPERGRQAPQREREQSNRQQSNRAPSQRQQKERQPQARVHQKAVADKAAPTTATKQKDVNPDEAPAAPVVSLADAWTRLNGILERYQNAEDFIFCVEKACPNTTAKQLSAFARKLESLEERGETQASIDDFIATTIGPGQGAEPATQGTL